MVWHVFSLVSFLLLATVPSRASLLVFGDKPEIVWDSIFAAFNERHPDVTVDYRTEGDSEQFKTDFASYLEASLGPDVIPWHAGERLEHYVQQGLVSNVTNIFQANNWTSTWPSNIIELASSSFGASNGTLEQYFVPTAYYAWALHYNPATFAALGITVPDVPQIINWTKFVDILDTCKANGLTPISLALGSGDWTAAGWFDYINMRLNGAEFHLNLLRGKEDWQDERVLNTLDVLLDMVHDDLFGSNMQSLSLIDAATELLAGTSCVTLSGDFYHDSPPFDVLDFFQFPQIVAGVPIGEAAPTDGFLVPAHSQKKEEAFKFLQAMGDAEVQISLVNFTAIPTNPEAASSTQDTHSLRAATLLQGADHLIQFFDRDASPDFAPRAMALIKNIFTDTVSSIMLSECLNDLQREVMLGIVSKPIVEGVSLGDGTVEISMTSRTPDATLYYQVVDEANANAASLAECDSNIYSAPFTVAEGRAVLAIAVMTGLTNSDIVYYLPINNADGGAELSKDLDFLTILLCLIPGAAGSVATALLLATARTSLEFSFVQGFSWFVLAGCICGCAAVWAVNVLCLTAIRIQYDLYFDGAYLVFALSAACVGSFVSIALLTANNNLSFGNALVRTEMIRNKTADQVYPSFLSRLNASYLCGMLVAGGSVTAVIHLLILSINGRFQIHVSPRSVIFTLLTAPIYCMVLERLLSTSANVYRFINFALILSGWMLSTNLVSQVFVSFTHDADNTPHGIQVESLQSLVLVIVSVTCGVAIALKYIRHLQIKKTRAENRTREEELFVAYVFHELRNPFNAVLGYLRFAYASLTENPQDNGVDPVKEQVRSDLSDALIACDRMTEMLENVLDLGKLASKSAVLKRQPVHLANLWSQILAVTRGVNRDIDVCLKLDTRLPPVVLGDGNKIKHILQNLLTNACTHCSEGSVVLEVSVLRWIGSGPILWSLPDEMDSLHRAQGDKCHSFNDRKTRVSSETRLDVIVPMHSISLNRRAEDLHNDDKSPQTIMGNDILKTSIPSNAEKVQIRFSVKDTGEGIPKEAIPLLFERYYSGSNSQVDTGSTVKPHRGFGLGLFLSNEFALLMQSQILVESPWQEDGSSGSHFYFEVVLDLPRASGQVSSTASTQLDSVIEDSKISAQSTVPPEIQSFSSQEHSSVAHGSSHQNKPLATDETETDSSRQDSENTALITDELFTAPSKRKKRRRRKNPRKVVNPLLKNWRVLIADDIEVNLRLLKRVLSKDPVFAPLQWQIEAVTTGEAAILSLESGKNFQLIILDQNMTKAGGKILGSQVVEYIHKNNLSMVNFSEPPGNDCKSTKSSIPAPTPKHPPLCVISSGNSSPADDMLYYESGASIIWSKPIPIASVIYQQIEDAMKESLATCQ